MHRYYVHKAWRAAGFSGVERDALLGGVALLAAAVLVAGFAGELGGLARGFGVAGLAGSALLKLERQRQWTPRADLRQVESYAVLCIVGTGGSRLLSTHPPVLARVRRLETLERRLQTAG